MNHDLAIVATALVTSVGLDLPSSCAAIRAMVSNPSQTTFLDRSGNSVIAHQVSLCPPSYGLNKLAQMAGMAIEEGLRDVPRELWGQVPLLLCVAEPERPGRLAGLEEDLMPMIESRLGATFAADSAVVAQGRVGVAVAMRRARRFLSRNADERALIVATDSLINFASVGHFDRAGRLLTATNSDGFIPGEGAGALLMSKPDVSVDQLICQGLGFGREPAGVDSGLPLRGEGLASAIKMSLSEAALEMHAVDFRITDLSGEHYYFKEASLATARTLRRLKEEFDLWHPAECTGETGAVAGAIALAMADVACRQGFSKGPSVLVHLGTDRGDRAAIKLHFGRARV